VIFWTPDHGAFVVRGAINAAWDKLLGATGKLGAPLGDRTVNKDVVTQKFTGGQISWNQTKNTFSTQPANLASALSGLQVPGQKTPAGSASTGGGIRGLAWHWWWLGVGIPVLLLIGLAVLVASRWRRRRAAERDAKAVEVGHSEAFGYEAVTESVSQWSPEADSDLESSGVSGGYRAPLRPRTVRLPSQPVSEWMPPAHTELVDELRDDGIEGPAEFSELAHFREDIHEDVGEDFDEDPDDVDTAPTGIPSASEARSGRHAAAEAEDDDAAITTAINYGRTNSANRGRAVGDSPSARRPVPGAGWIPVKANASFGLYYMPDSFLYEDTLAEIWFVNEEIAQANGFHKAG